MDIGLKGTRLSSIGLAVTEYDVGFTQPTPQYQSIRGRTTRTLQETTFSPRKLSLTALYVASSVAALDNKRQALRNLLTTSDSIAFETINHASDSPEIGFKKFSEADVSSDLLDPSYLSNLASTGTVNPIYYEVFLTGFSDEIIARPTSSKMIVKFDFTFESASTPFGLADSSTAGFSSSVPYNGSHPLDMREYPWKLQYTLSASTSLLKLTIGSDVYELSYSLKAGDVVTISALQTLVNSSDVTYASNFKCFTIQKGSTLTASVSGTAKLVGAKEFYR